MTDHPHIFVWGDPLQLPMIRKALRELGAAVVGAGGATPRAGADLAEALGAERDDDLREVVRRDDFEVLLLTPNEPLGPEVRKAVRGSGIPAVSTLPDPCSFIELAESGEPPAATFVPAMQAAPGMIAAEAFMDEFGSPTSVSVAMRFGRSHGSLFARLYDAVTILCSMLGVCEQVDAAVTGSETHVGESLPGMTGGLTAHLRFSGGRSAVVSILSGPCGWFRGVTAQTDAALLRITDASCSVMSGDDSDADESDEVRDPARPVDPGVLIASQIRRLRGGVDPVRPEPDHTRIIAICEAVRISCKTGHTESPMRLLEIVRGG